MPNTELGKRGAIGLVVAAVARRLGPLPRNLSARLGPAAHTPLTREAEHGADADARQMKRLSAVVQTVADRGARAGRCHASAAQRIDAALYELEQLRGELVGVLRGAVVRDVPKQPLRLEPSLATALATASVAPLSAPVTAVPATALRSAA